MYGFALAVFLGGMVFSMPMDVKAPEIAPAFYAATYADVVQALGTDNQIMYDHYLT